MGVDQDPNLADSPHDMPEALEMPSELEVEINLARAARDKAQERLDNVYDQGLLEYTGNDVESVRAWTERMRAETDLLKSADSLGLDMFVDDVTAQPRFAVPVDIAYEEGGGRQAGHSQNVVGYAEVVGTRLRLAGAAPTRYQQVADFVATGQLNYQVAKLHHELIHKYHFAIAADPTQVETLVTESHAYSNGIVEPMSLGTVDETVAHIHKAYGLNPDRIRSVTEDILFLQGVGMDPAEIGRIIAGINPAIESSWWMREKVVQPYMEQQGISEAEKKQMIELYLLKVEKDMLRARTMFFDVAVEQLSPEE
jgi:hypothetical protein